MQMEAPTYYRKLRYSEQCSSAELEAILKIAQALADDMLFLIGRCHEAIHED